MKKSILLLTLVLLLVLPIATPTLLANDPNLLVFLKMDEASGDLQDSSIGSPQFVFQTNGNPFYQASDLDGHTGIGFDGTGDFFNNSGLAKYLNAEDDNQTMGVFISADVFAPSGRDLAVSWREETIQWGGAELNAGSSSCGQQSKYNAMMREDDDGGWACVTDVTPGVHDHICAVMKINTSGISIYTNGTQIDFTAQLGGIFGNVKNVALGGDSEDGSIGANNFLGNMSYFAMWNRTLTDAEIVEFCDTGIESPPSLELQEFTLTAKDTYDDTAIINFTFNISNSSFSFSESTVNGTFKVNNQSVPSFDSLYKIEFRSNDTGGYFNRTFRNINIIDTGSFEADLFQSVLKLMTLDGLTNQTISDFSASTNKSSDSTTTGELLILIKNGTFQLNVTALGFDKLTTSFTIDSLENNSLNVSMGSIFTFRLVREETNTPFESNLTNSTDLTVFCPNATIRIKFNETNNISQIINCQFELMQMTVDYGILGSYFRTLIPPFSQKNITWYLIDLINGDTAIQKVIQLIDLTGDFSNATLRVKRAIPGETVLKTMIEQKFDISNEVNLFLVKDALYTINIENADEDVALGNLIPTEAGTQTITLPKIDFVPKETTLGSDISWAYTFNATLGILRVQYVDTTNLTTLVRFIVRNGSSPGLKQLFLGESNNNATVTITFNQALANNTYITELFFEHPGLSSFTELRTFYEFLAGTGSALNFEGWDDEEQSTFKKWIAWFFIAVWGMIWTRRYVGIGMTTLVIWLWVFRTLKWIDVSNVVFGFVGLLAVVAWIAEAMKQE